MKRMLILFVGAFLLAGTAAGQTGKRERSEQGWLGVSIRDVTRDLVEEEDLKSDDGAYVASVVKESPADSAGIKKGDVIVEFSGRRIYDADDLSKTVRRMSPGTAATAVVMRQGDKKTLSVIVGNRRQRESFAARAPMVRMFQRWRGGLGMTMITLNEQLAEYFGAPNKEGVLIEEVKKGSAAEKAGLSAGDVILKIGSKPVGDVGDLHRSLRKYDAGEKVEFEVLRRGSKKTVTVELDEDPVPWGFGGHPVAPRLHVSPPDLDFRYDIDLRRLEEEMERIGPMIERQTKDLKDRISRTVRVSLERTI